MQDLMAKAGKKYVIKTVRRLQGILSGIEIDRRFTNKEVAGLRQWLEDQGALVRVHPFKEVATMLSRALEDGVLDPTEQWELDEWCTEFLDDNAPWTGPFDYAMGHLHGILNGMAIDGQITSAEIHGLKRWMKQFDECREMWPFNDVWAVVQSILEDGKVDAEEKEMFLAFCKEFSDIRMEGAQIKDDFYSEEWLEKYGNKILKPTTYICDDDAPIVFEGKVFCFTGPAKFAKRSVLQGMVEELGGSWKKSYSKKVNYLVMGDYASPAWVYSTYGRKIEEAMDNQRAGMDIRIVQEGVFLDAYNQLK